jgi:hypothetical protein
MIRLLLLCWVITAPMAQAQAPATQPAWTIDFDPAALTFRGEPIHPLLLEPFLGDFRDGSPRVRAVNVSAGQLDHARDRVASTPRGLSYTDRRESGSVERRVVYRIAGTLPAGRVVLEARANYGGTASLWGLLVVRLHTMPSLSLTGPADPQLMLTLDAYTAGMTHRSTRDVTLDGEQVTIAWHDRADDRSSTTVIDLSMLDDAPRE